MEMFRFDPEVGKAIARFDSGGFVISAVAQLPRGAVVNCAYLSAGGLIGYHQATVPQLLLVVDGEGWVRAETTDRIPIRAGQAAFWTEGEWHESGTDKGMTALIIESPKLEPGAFMPPI